MAWLQCSVPLVLLAACVLTAPAPGGQDTRQVGDSARQNYLHNGMPDVWEVLARHGALEVAHQLARKSARSPSRRLRFGRRSDPLMPPAPEQELDELVSQDLALDPERLGDSLMNLRQQRTPVRMRFGRRSAETAVPHILPGPDGGYEETRKDTRTPSLRLRFGRRDLFMLPYEQAERDYRATADEPSEAAEE